MQTAHDCTHSHISLDYLHTFILEGLSVGSFKALHDLAQLQPTLTFVTGAAELVTFGSRTLCEIKSISMWHDNSHAASFYLVFVFCHLGLLLCHRLFANLVFVGCAVFCGIATRSFAAQLISKIFVLPVEVALVVISCLYIIQQPAPAVVDLLGDAFHLAHIWQALCVVSDNLTKLILV